jgi:hypothetical protein
MMHRLRTVREEPEYQEDIRAILRNPAPNPQLLDELLGGVHFVLARNPMRGTKIPNSTLWVIAQPLPALSQVIRVYYEFDNDLVIMRAASAVEAD